MTTNRKRLPLNRRRFLHHALAGVPGTLVISRSTLARATAPNARIQFAVVGGYHYHVDRMVRAVLAGGGRMAWVFDADPGIAAELSRKFPQARAARSERQILEDPAIALVVSADTPARRAALGIRVMQAGKDFMADKGGILYLEQLEQVKRVQAQTKRFYSISYNEHLLDLGTVEAVKLVRAGAVGKVVRTISQAPHGLKGAQRPAWWFTQAGRGGIFADIGTHQCCDFLQFSGTTNGLTVDAARTGNRDNPQHPELEDFGDAEVRGNGGAGRIEVSWSEKSKPRTLLAEGAEGRLEILKGGETGGKLTLTDKRGTRTVSLKQTGLDYGPHLVDDVLNRTQIAMAQSQTFLATELALRIQNAAPEFRLDASNRPSRRGLRDAAFAIDLYNPNA